jgi:hypothetical protein
VAARLVAGEAPAREVDVIPQPKQVTFERGAFAVDEFCVVLVSEKATRGTRRAARAIQVGIREWLGLDVPIIRIAEQPAHGQTRPIWVVEPALRRPPARTIGVEGLKFTEAMGDGGYFIRVDAVEAVVHGADDAGSYYGAQTLLQLIRPGRKGSLFRKGRPPTIPCLWIKDWPSQLVRSIPTSYGWLVDVQLVGAAVREQLIEFGAHYKLNALPKGLLTADPGIAARLRRLAAWRGIRIVEQPPLLADSPLRTALRADAACNLRLTVAVRAEVAWGPPDPDAETLLRRFGLDSARHPARRKPAAQGKRKLRSLDDIEEGDQDEAE